MYNTVSIINTPANKVSAISKLYVWSVALEPLLFFVVANPEFIGVTANISKLLQLLVFIGLFFRLLVFHTIKIPSPLSNFNRRFFYYFTFAILSGLFGLVSGAYKIEVDSETINTLRVYIRPLFEYFILLYYFIYFTILPRYILYNTKSIKYFFKVFCLLLFITLLVGFTELVLMKTILPEFRVPRHFGEETFVGSRFHGLAGEPRDAFVYLVMGLGMLILRDLWYGRKKFNKYLIVLIIVAALLTQSASGLIGLLFFILLLVVFFPYKLIKSKRLTVKYIFILIVVSFIFVIGAYSSGRVMVYFDAMIGLVKLLEGRELIGSILYFVSNNIFPLWHRWLEIIEFNFIPTLIGTGLGSSSFINNNYYDIFSILPDSDGISNPNANIIRIFYEVGIIGIYLSIYAFLYPIKKIKLPKREYLILYVLMLLMLASSFAHRTVAPFLFLGVLLAVFNDKLSRTN